MAVCSTSLLQRPTQLPAVDIFGHYSAGGASIAQSCVFRLHCLPSVPPRCEPHASPHACQRAGAARAPSSPPLAHPPRPWPIPRSSPLFLLHLFLLQLHFTCLIAATSTVAHPPFVCPCACFTRSLARSVRAIVHCPAIGGTWLHPRLHLRAFARISRAFTCASVSSRCDLSHSQGFTRARRLDTAPCCLSFPSFALIQGFAAPLRRRDVFSMHSQSPSLHRVYFCFNCDTAPVPALCAPPRSSALLHCLFGPTTRLYSPPTPRLRSVLVVLQLSRKRRGYRSSGVTYGSTQRVCDDELTRNHIKATQPWRRQQGWYKISSQTQGQQSSMNLIHL